MGRASHSNIKIIKENCFLLYVFSCPYRQFVRFPFIHGVLFLSIGGRFVSLWMLYRFRKNKAAHETRYKYISSHNNRLSAFCTRAHFKSLLFMKIHERDIKICAEHRKKNIGEHNIWGKIFRDGESKIYNPNYLHNVRFSSRFVAKSGRTIK